MHFQKKESLTSLKILKNDFQFAKVDNDPMLESICLEENAMINPLDEFCIEEKVRSCFAKSENMVEEMIRRVESENLSMFSSSSTNNNCRLGEINGDHALNSCSLENYLETNVLSKGGIPGVIKEHGRVDSSSIIADRDPMQESFFFQVDTILGFPNHI